MFSRNLDTKTSIEIMGIFASLNKEKGITIILVTHEADIATYANRVIHVRDGVIEREDIKGDFSKIGKGEVS